MNVSSQITNTNEAIVNTNEWLRAVPVELSNTVPESVWMTLTLEAKKDLLRQNGLLEKYEGTTENLPVQNEVDLKVAEAPVAEVIVTQQEKVQRSPEFAKAVEELKDIDKQAENKKTEQPVLSKEDISRIETEKAQSASIKSYKFFGYQPSTTTYSSAKQISNTGNIDDSRTWAATLIAKLFSLFE